MEKKNCSQCPLIYNKRLAISLLKVLYYFMHMPMCASVLFVRIQNSLPVSFPLMTLQRMGTMAQKDISFPSFASFQLLSSTEPESSLLISCN